METGIDFGMFVALESIDVDDDGIFDVWDDAAEYSAEHYETTGRAAYRPSDFV